VSLLDESSSVAEEVEGIQTFDLMQIMLNPWSQEVHRIGRATIQDSSNPLTDYDTLFACPSPQSAAESARHTHQMGVVQALVTAVQEHATNNESHHRQPPAGNRH
jgi:hypothetical protein